MEATFNQNVESGRTKIIRCSIYRSGCSIKVRIGQFTGSVPLADLLAPNPHGLNLSGKEPPPTDVTQIIQLLTSYLQERMADSAAVTFDLNGGQESDPGIQSLPILENRPTIE